MLPMVHSGNLYGEALKRQQKANLKYDKNTSTW